jgi:FkbM family methyltransferase
MLSRRTPPLPEWLSESVRRDPVRFVDVGARGGWQGKWRARQDHLMFIGIEADREECARLRASAKPNERFIDQGLYHSVGEVSLYHCDPPARTSIYRPNRSVMKRIYGTPDATRVTHVEQIPVTTFDLAIKSLDVGSIDFIKLDTQGSELDILRGAEDALNEPMIGIEVEVEFLAIYEEQPLFSEVAAYLAARSFEFIDFLSTYSVAWMRFGQRALAGYGDLTKFLNNWRSLIQTRGGLRGGQRLVYADALFLREPTSWLAAVQRYGDASRSLALRGLFTVCVVGYYEQAADVANLLRDAGVLTRDEHTEALSFITAGLQTWSRAKEDLILAGARLAHRLRHVGVRER